MSTLASVIGKGLLSARPASSIAGALYYATDTLLLYRDNGSSWEAVSANNPMTTSGDIIYGGSSGLPTRLAKGSDGQVLTLASGLPSWAAAAGGSLTSASQIATADTTSTANTLVDSTGTTISLAAGSWLVWAKAAIDTTAGATYAIATLADGSNTELDRATQDQSVAATRMFALFAPVTPGSTTSYKVRFQTGTANSVCKQNAGVAAAVFTRIMALKFA